MIIKVITIELATGKLYDERTTRLNTEAGQRWLHRHMTFAFSNGMGVQMLNQDDSEPVAPPAPPSRFPEYVYEA